MQLHKLGMGYGQVLSSKLFAPQGRCGGPLNPGWQPATVALHASADTSCLEICMWWLWWSHGGLRPDVAGQRLLPVSLMATELGMGSLVTGFICAQWY